MIKFLKDEEGRTTIEYAFIAFILCLWVLVVGGIIAALFKYVFS